MLTTKSCAVEHLDSCLSDSLTRALRARVSSHRAFGPVRELTDVEHVNNKYTLTLKHIYCWEALLLGGTTEQVLSCTQREVNPSWLQSQPYYQPYNRARDEGKLKFHYRI